MPKSFGFTLIELLIVVAIIGILSGVGVVAFSGIQQSARDAKRKADVDAISKALEAKYDFASGKYLLQSGLADSDFTSGTVPKDNGQDYHFERSGDEKAFIVCATTLEKENQPYCKYSANGSTASIATLTVPAMDEEQPPAEEPPPPPAPACSTNFPQQCRLWGPANGETILIDCPVTPLNCSGNADNQGGFQWYHSDGTSGGWSVFWGDQYEFGFPLATVQKR